MSNTNLDIWIAGAFAALSVDLLVYPLDSLKTRYQSVDYRRLYLKSNGSINKPVLFRGLYQGLSSAILATVPSSGAFFTTYEAVKSTLLRSNHQLLDDAVPLPLIHSLSSGSAELVSCFILTPAEVLKQNAQMLDSKLEKHPLLTVLRRFRRQPTELWRGYIALALRNLPYTAMQFPMLEFMKERMRDHRKQAGTFTGSTLESGTLTAISAGLSGSLTAVIVTPLDVTKTRMMLSAGKSEAEAHAVVSNTKDVQIKGRPGILAVAEEILKHEGIPGLFRGAILRSCWTMLGSGLYLGVYEGARDHLQKGRESEQMRNRI